MASTPRRLSHGSLPNDQRSEGVDVGFNGNRFLQRILQEAQRGKAANNAAAVHRLENMGFSSEVASIALGIAAGDENRALEICMSGLAFTSMGFCSDGQSSTLSPQKPSPPPAPLRCYICGQQHLSQKSLDFHSKACRRRFLLRESKRQADKQRPLLEEWELPDGFDCLERYYEVEAATPHAVVANAQETQAPVSVEPPPLQACQYCARTFAPDRIERHQRACVERPKVVDAAPPRRRSGSGSVPTPSAPPAAATKAFESFCQHLAQCPGCARQFRPEILPAHIKTCAHAQPKATPKIRRQPAGSNGKYSSSFNVPTAPPASVAPRHGSKNAVSSTAEGQSGYRFAPPGRQSYGSRRNSTSSGPTVGRRTSLPGKEADADTAQGEDLSSESLLAKGDLVCASGEDEVWLRAEIEEHLPDVEIVGAFKVGCCSQQGIYNAMKMAMRGKSPGCEEPAERELWHGTSWATVSKILKHGFNRSFAGRHGTLLGMATYFSSDPAYSNRFCDRRGGGRDGTRVLLLSRVLVGRYCRGCSADVEPPIADQASGTRFDSTVDNPDRPKIFAVFRDFQAVPLFMVEYRC